MEFTGERQVGKTLDEIDKLHIERYQIALREIKHYFSNCNSILDIGCGIGYGSYILSELESNITSYDISEEAINFAKTYYNKDNVNYSVVDCSNVSFIKDNYDTIVSFEFLEHIHYYRAKEILKEMIEKSSLCITSIPINNESPFHKFILNEKEIEEFYYGIVNMIPNKKILKTSIQDNKYYICIIGDKI